MRAKKFLVGAFIVAAGIGGNIVWLAHDNAEARDLVTQTVGTVTSSTTGILWGNRFGASIAASGTHFTAKKPDGSEVEGVIHKPLFGKPVLKWQAPKS